MVKKLKLQHLKVVMAIFSVFTLVLTGAPISQALSEGMRDFYSSNDIMFYDPEHQICSPGSGTVGSEAGSAVGSDNAERIFNYLTSTTFTGLGGPMNAIQASGVLGNFYVESGLDPGQAQIRGSAYGIAQWDGARRTALENFASREGEPVSDLNVQLRFLKLELDGWEGQNLANGGFMTVSTPAEATEVFLVRFERAGVPHLDRRVQAAEQFHDRLGASGGSVATAGNPCGVSGAGGVGTGDFMSESFITYAQCATSTHGGPWGNNSTPGGTMCSEGCGPTSLAMVVRNMTGQNVTPQETWQYYNQNNLWGPGFGSGPQSLQSAASNWGLRTESINPRQLSSYQEVFANGGLVIAGGLGAVPFYPGFGHYVVVRGITADGQRFLVSDPGRGLVGEFDVHEFMTSAGRRPGNSVAFYQ